MPMQALIPVDVAEACRLWLVAHDVDACCDPLPQDLEHRLPLVLVQPLGGSRADVVVDSFGVRLYGWAATYEAAIANVSLAAGLLEAMAGQVVDGSQCYAVSVDALPYPAYDPSHQDIPRACTTATVTMRAKAIEI